MQIGDRVHDDTKRPAPMFGKPGPNDLVIVGDPVPINPDGWVLGKIVSVAEAETCSACGQAKPSNPVPRWNIDWDDGRNTVQYEDSLVAVV